MKKHTLSIVGLGVMISLLVSCTTTPEKNPLDAREPIHVAEVYYKNGREQKTYEQEQIEGKLLRGRPALKRNLQKNQECF